jgi:hypothetical protein
MDKKKSSLFLLIILTAKYSQSPPLSLYFEKFLFSLFGLIISLYVSNMYQKLKLITLVLYD